MPPPLSALWHWAGAHVFRFWTALTVLGGYGWLWLNRPEYLTWWKREIDALVRGVCAWLPYPWGDRIESTLGNFGIWVQLTLAILAFRVLLGGIMMAARARRRRGRPNVVRDGAVRDAAVRDRGGTV